MRLYTLVLQEGQKLIEDGNKKFDKIEVDPDELKILLFTKDKSLRQMLRT